MQLISHLIWHFKKMYLIGKVLILVGIAFFAYALYSFFSYELAWPEYRGTWLIAASSTFLILSQFGSHLFDMKNKKLAKPTNSHTKP